MSNSQQTWLLYGTFIGDHERLLGSIFADDEAHAEELADAWVDTHIGPNEGFEGYRLEL